MRRAQKECSTLATQSSIPRPDSTRHTSHTAEMLFPPESIDRGFRLGPVHTAGSRASSFTCTVQFTRNTSTTQASPATPATSIYRDTRSPEKLQDPRAILIPQPAFTFRLSFIFEYEGVFIRHHITRSSIRSSNNKRHDAGWGPQSETLLFTVHRPHHLQCTVEGIC